MQKVLRIIDSVSEYSGKVLSWFCSILIFIIVYDVSMRYIFNAPTMWAHETAIMLGGTIYVLGWAYTQRHSRHIRIDIIYAHLPPRIKALVDVGGFLVLLTPLFLVLIVTSFSWMLESWSMGEKSTETYWYPPLAPFRTVVFIGFCLFFIQSAAQFVRTFYLLVRNKVYE